MKFKHTIVHVWWFLFIFLAYIGLYLFSYSVFFYLLLAPGMAWFLKAKLHANIKKKKELNIKYLNIDGVQFTWLLPVSLPEICLVKGITKFCINSQSSSLLSAVSLTFWNRRCLPSLQDDTGNGLQVKYCPFFNGPMNWLQVGWQRKQQSYNNDYCCRHSS